MNSTIRNIAKSCLRGALLTVAAFNLAVSSPSAFAATAGEDCDDAGVIGPGLFMDSDTTAGRNDDYDLDSAGANGDCGTGAATDQLLGQAPDAVYQIFTADACLLTISADPTGAAWNLALYVLKGSCNPGGFSNATCAGLSDAGLDDVTESLTIQTQAGATYFLVVDGVNSANGTFDITVDCCPDSDGDMVCDAVDLCTGNDATGDTDADGVCDGNDNCPTVANADQADANANGVGDLCETGGPGGQPAGQPTGQCGCGSGADILLVVPFMLLGTSRMRRRRR